jgi:hypothetical protein
MIRFKFPDDSRTDLMAFTSDGRILPLMRPDSPVSIASDDSGLPTIGAGSCPKAQPWRAIIAQTQYSQPMDFAFKHVLESQKDIRLLEELDAKGR